MKKVFKLIPVALGLLALASCSNDDDFASEKLVANNGTLTVTTETQFDGDAITRSAVGYARVGTSKGNGTLWGTFFLPGDQIKVYGTESWKYQVWEKTDSEEAPSVENAGSVVSSSFTLKKVLKADATEADELFGFDKVGHAVYPANLAVFANEERSGITVTNFISENGTIELAEAKGGGETPKAYAYPIKSTYEDLGNSKLFSCNVPLWGKAKDSKCDMKNLAGLMKIAFQGKEIEAGQQIIITAGTEEYLWGDADVEDFNYDGEDIPVITNKTLTVKKDADGNVLNNKLTIKLPALTGDNYILVPIPAGEYAKLEVAYASEDGNPIEGNEYKDLNVATGFFKVEDKAFWALTVTKEESISDDNIYPSTIQKAITETYGNFGRNVVVDVKNALQVGGTAEKEGYTTITLPELKNTVTLNLKDGITQYKTADATAKLVIKGGDGTGKLVINVPGDKSSAAAIDASAVAVPVEISYANSSALEKDVTINDKVTLTGSYASVKAAEALTIANDVTITTLESTADVTVEKGTITTVKAEKATVKGEATVTNVNAKEVSVEDVNVASVEAADKVTIDAKDKTVTTLKLTGAAEVTLKNGTITTIEATEEAAEATIYSEGASLIGTVTGTVKSITSKWDGESKMGSILNSSKPTNIYTAAHLATNLTKHGSSILLNIFANEIDLDNKDWTGILIYTVGSTKGNLTLNGKGATIKNVKLAGNNGFIGTVPSSVKVRDLTLDGVSYNGEAGEKVGALIGAINAGTSTISGVTVKNAKIQGDADSHDLGGLIGTVAGGTVTVTNTTVDAAVEGYYNLGVVIGSIATEAEVVLGSSSDEVQYDTKVMATSSIKVVKDLSEYSADEKAGKAAIVVGELSGKLNLADFYNNLAASKIKTDDLFYNKQRVTIGGKDKFFKGNLSASGAAQYFVGYSPAAQEYKKVNTLTITNCYDGTTYKEVTKNAFNVFK